MQSRLPLTITWKASEAARQVTTSVWPRRLPRRRSWLGAVGKQLVVVEEDPGVKERPLWSLPLEGPRNCNG